MRWGESPMKSPSCSSNIPSVTSFLGGKYSVPPQYKYSMPTEHNLSARSLCDVITGRDDLPSTFIARCIRDACSTSIDFFPFFLTFLIWFIGDLCSSTPSAISSSSPSLLFVSFSSISSSSDLDGLFLTFTFDSKHLILSIIPKSFPSSNATIPSPLSVFSSSSFPPDFFLALFFFNILLLSQIAAATSIGRTRPRGIAPTFNSDGGINKFLISVVTPLTTVNTCLDCISGSAFWRACMQHVVFGTKNAGSFIGPLFFVILRFELRFSFVVLSNMDLPLRGLPEMHLDGIFCLPWLSTSTSYTISICSSSFCSSLLSYFPLFRKIVPKTLRPLCVTFTRLPVLQSVSRFTCPTIFFACLFIFFLLIFLLALDAFVSFK